MAFSSHYAVACILCSVCSVACSRHRSDSDRTSPSDASIDSQAPAALEEGGAADADPPSKGSHAVKDLGEGRCISVNSHGDVVGVNAARETFLIEHGGAPKELGTIGAGLLSVGVSIDDARNVVGYSEGSGGRRAIRWSAQDAAWQAVDVDAAAWSALINVGDAGELVGTAGAGTPGLRLAFAQMPTGTIALPLAKDRSSAAHAARRGRIAGILETENHETHAFLFEGAKLIDLGTLGGRLSNAYALNANGDVAGTSLDERDRPRAFVVRHGMAMVAIAMPPGARSSDARGMDDTGRIAMNVQDDRGVTSPMLVEADGAVQSLLPEGFVMAQVSGMSANGYVVGWGIPAGVRNDGFRCLLWEPEANQ